MFNVFRIIGDLLHLLSFFILLLKLLTLKNCRGISLKTQILYVIVFVTRYLDLFYNFASLYNEVLKVVFIVLSITIVYIIRFHKPHCETYDAKLDDFFLPYLIVPCLILGVLINEYFTVIEILWAFSIYLEAVAIVPQLLVVHKMAQQSRGFVESLTSHYVFTLGGYRAFYLLNWVYRFFTEPGYRSWIVWIAGAVQTAIYCDFFYYYFLAVTTGKQFNLPI